MSFNLINLVLLQKLFSQISSNGWSVNTSSKKLSYFQVSSWLSLSIGEGEILQSIKYLHKNGPEISLP